MNERRDVYGLMTERCDTVLKILERRRNNNEK